MANELMEFREIIAVYRENYRTGTNTLCGGKIQNYLMLKEGGTYSNNHALRS
jgi:hypothetical protein